MFDLLYTIGLGVFSFDIVVHFLIDPEYFRFNPPRIFYWFLCCCCFGCCFRDKKNDKKETEDTTKTNKRGKRKGGGNDPSEKTTNTKGTGSGGKGGTGGSKKNRSLFSSDHGICGIGSFKFWCDVLSTAMFIYDISYFNRTNQKVLHMEIFLNEYGIPVRMFICVLCWVGVGLWPTFYTLAL